ncbi:hypothetical protein B0H67DRAFT_487189 [Lasiosphaeris hirsuta]|uniref:Uncharacterized protein n=1 Tax=Lasiosphaeris hirsuta TaxID=260670 RepID=A0AA40AQP5_9PEZI|nr:hypothetical protein B0H67DRAFT_487189 [Lasiosphaeris hirsuta]
MSKATPRKSKHRNHPSHSGPRQIAASDYESDATHYMEAREPRGMPHLPSRSNTDLNLSVLRRHLADVRSILSIAANAVVYTFSEATQGWDKHGVEGTMFVCEQEPIVTATGQALPRVCVFVLNRRGLDNLVVDLVRVSDCEMADELMVFRLEDDGDSDGSGSDEGNNGGIGGNGSTEKRGVIGIWIHADEDDTRDINTTIIRGAWQQARLALHSLMETAAAEAEQAAEQTDADDGGALADSQEDIRENASPVGKRPSAQAAQAMDEKPDAISQLVQSHLATISAFRQSLDEQDFGELSPKIKARIDKHESWLVNAEQHRDSVLDDHVVEPWELVVQRAGKLHVVVTGPASDDRVELEAKDEKEAEYIMGDEFLGFLSEYCQGFADMEKSMVRLMQLSVALERERAELSQPPEVTVQTHIRLLKQYNEMKDIGQQLIGLVAENKGVPIRALYEGGDYSVSAED